jgi:hypothetical protein
MRFTDTKPGAKHSAVPTGTLQLFSFKIASIAKELRWPLDVYGLIAIRDHLDRNRTHTRDNCQTITAEVCPLNLLLATHYFTLGIIL